MRRLERGRAVRIDDQRKQSLYVVWFNEKASKLLNSTGPARAVEGKVIELIDSPYRQRCQVWRFEGFQGIEAALARPGLPVPSKAG